MGYYEGNFSDARQEEKQRTNVFPAIVISPTADSGFDSVLAVKTVLTACAWDWKRVGA